MKNVLFPYEQYSLHISQKKEFGKTILFCTKNINLKIFWHRPQKNRDIAYGISQLLF